MLQTMECVALRMRGSRECGLVTAHPLTTAFVTGNLPHGTYAPYPPSLIQYIQYNYAIYITVNKLILLPI